MQQKKARKPILNILMWKKIRQKEINGFIDKKCENQSFIISLRGNWRDSDLQLLNIVKMLCM